MSSNDATRFLESHGHFQSKFDRYQKHISPFDVSPIPDQTPQEHLKAWSSAISRREQVSLAAAGLVKADQGQLERPRTRLAVNLVCGSYYVPC